MKELYLIRHAETLWSKKGKHTGTTDLSLTMEGRAEAQSLYKRIKNISFNHTFSSPLQRALETCKICKLEKQAIITKELTEWNYGKYEGLTSAQILKKDPNWNIYTCGAPGGESVDDISLRVLQLFHILAPLQGKIALFSSGHFSKAIAVKWLGLPLSCGNLFSLNTSCYCILSHEKGFPIIKLWNAGAS